MPNILQKGVLMGNRKNSKRLVFTLLASFIIAIGICMPIVGTTLASNDTTKASPVASNASTIETSSKVDKTAEKISLSYILDGDIIYENKDAWWYTPAKAITAKFENCYDSNYYYAKDIPGAQSLPRAFLRLVTESENELKDYDAKKINAAFSVLGYVDYRLTVQFDFGNIFRDADAKSTKLVPTSDVYIRFLECNANNIHLPTSVRIKGSVDGVNFVNWGGYKVVHTTKCNGFNIVEWTITRDTFANVRYLNIEFYQKGKRNLTFDNIDVMTRASNIVGRTSDYEQVWDMYSDYMIDTIQSDAQFNNYLVKFTKGEIIKYGPDKTKVVNMGTYGAGITPNGMLQSITSYAGSFKNRNYDTYNIKYNTSNGYNISEIAVTEFYPWLVPYSRGAYGIINSYWKTSKDIVVGDYIVGNTCLNNLLNSTLISNSKVGTPIVEIGSKAFANKGRINSLTIGRNIHTIASDAFTGTQITNIYIDPANVTYYVKNNTLYDKTGKVIYKGTASTGGEIAEPSKSVNELIKKAGYLVDIAGNEKLLRNIKPCTLISDFVAQFNGKQIKINGVLTTKLKGNYIKTGDKLTIDGLQFIALVWGDGNGDGKVNAADYILARRSILNMVELNTYQTRALCVTGTSKITTADYIKIRKYIMGEITL